MGGVALTIDDCSDDDTIDHKAARFANYLGNFFRSLGPHRSRRTVKVALTCGEESGSRLNGAHWLVENQRELIDAAFAINECGVDELDAQGRRVALEVEAGEKTAQNFRLDVMNPGGHSSRPRKDNAIYTLAAALKRIEAYEFPAQFIDANKAYFAGWQRFSRRGGEATLAAAMAAIVRDPQDIQTITLVSAADPTWNATHHLRRDDAQGRPRAKRAAAAGARQHKLSDLPGRNLRCSSRAARNGNSRSDGPD